MADSAWASQWRQAVDKATIVGLTIAVGFA
jgi:hypothetical protein